MSHPKDNQDKDPKPVKLTLVDEVELKHIIDQLDLEPQQQEFIKARWLKYVIWWDKRSKDAKGPYHVLRATAAIAGVITSALVGANLGGVELGLPFPVTERLRAEKAQLQADRTAAQ